jgi:hypothetical protein
VPIDHAVPDSAGFMVTGIASAQQWTAQARSEGFDNALLEYLFGAGVQSNSQLSHGVPPVVCPGVGSVLLS